MALYLKNERDTGEGVYMSTLNNEEKSIYCLNCVCSGVNMNYLKV